MECKRTDAVSYRLQLAEWRKIQVEAALAGKLPVMQVEIDGVKVAVIDWNLFEERRH